MERELLIKELYAMIHILQKKTRIDSRDGQKRMNRENKIWD